MHKTSENENIFVLNFINSNNLKDLLPIFYYHFISFLEQEKLLFQIIFVTLRKKSKR